LLTIGNQVRTQQAVSSLHNYPSSPEAETLAHAAPGVLLDGMVHVMQQLAGHSATG
jgi:hypothetical protein